MPNLARFSSGAARAYGLCASSGPSLSPFAGGNQSVASLYALATTLSTASAVATPTAGGTLTVNGNAMGSYDYMIKNGDQVVSAFNNTDWFTTTADTRSAWISVTGALTINAGQTFIPTNRKLFTCLVVKGLLTVNGTISMTGRGANHSGTGNSGGATTAVAIRIITGTYSSVTNPEVPAAGGAGVSSGGASGAGGNAGTNGGTGSGGTGGNGDQQGTGPSAAGTSFSGGSGAGTKGNGQGGATGATANGGAGGPAFATTDTAPGGTGNPGGTSRNTTALDGTGGVLIIFALGGLAGSGSIQAQGVAGQSGTMGAGGSGGGSVTVLTPTNTSSITPSAAGGGGGGGISVLGGGGGGAGTARILTLV